MEARKAAIILAVAALLLALPLSYAQQGGQQEGMGDAFSRASGTLQQQGEDFVYSTTRFAGTIPTTFTTVYGAFLPATCDDPMTMVISGGTSPAVGLWLAPAITVLFIVAMGVAIFYMVGQLLSSPNLIAMAKDEGFQTAMTAVRLLFIMGALLAADTWYGLSRPGGDRIYSTYPAMIDASMAVSRLMVSEMTTQYSMLVIYNTVIHTIYSSTMWFGITWRAMYSFNLGPVLRPVIDLIGTSLQFLSLGMSEWLLHVLLLCMIKKYMWGFFIPLGLLLRAFPYTRNAGEALLSLSFALAIFYPFMFLFTYEVHKLMSYNLVDARGAMGAFINQSGILSVFALVLAVSFLTAGVFMPFFLGGAINLLFELVRSAVYYIVIISVLMPFLNIFVTLTVAKETAKVFNVDVNFMSFLKII